MREVEQIIVDLFNSGEEVYIPDIAEKIIDKRQGKFVKERSAEKAINRHVMNYIRSVLRRFDIRVRSPKNLTLKKLVTARDYQLLRQKKINQKFRIEDEIRSIEQEMVAMGYPIQVVADYEGGESIAQNAKQDSFRPVARTSAESKKVVNG